MNQEMLILQTQHNFFLDFSEFDTQDNGGQIQEETYLYHTGEEEL